MGAGSPRTTWDSADSLTPLMPMGLRTPLSPSTRKVRGTTCTTRWRGPAAGGVVMRSSSTSACEKARAALPGSREMVAAALMQVRWPPVMPTCADGRGRPSMAVASSTERRTESLSSSGLTTSPFLIPSETDRPNASTSIDPVGATFATTVATLVVPMSIAAYVCSLTRRICCSSYS